jgi:hypothetical protein
MAFVMRKKKDPAAIEVKRDGKGSVDAASFMKERPSLQWIDLSYLQSSNGYPHQAMRYISTY